jgi:hypothetical protein
MTAKMQVTSEGSVVHAHTIKAYKGWEVLVALWLF